MKQRVLKRESKKSFLTVIMVLCLSVLTILGIALSVGKTNKVDAYRSEGGAEVAKTVAQEGITLLRNENDCLPLKYNMKVGGLGSPQDTDFTVGGGGSGYVNNGGNTIDPKTGLENSAKQGLISSYTAMGSASGSFDRVIYFIKRYSTEDNDMVVSDFYLADYEKNDVTNLINAFGAGNVIIVLNIPSVIDTTWLIQQNVGAIVCMWLPGEQGGTALANVLTGAVTPSGKLPDTWAKSYEDYITSYGCSDAVSQFGNSANVNYYEDIYVGYRYFETFDPNYEKVNYEFGFGLSYTTFDINTKGININKNTGKIKLYVNVKNTGSTYSGKEVVQVYYSTPNDKIDSPAKQLIGYAKTSSLVPGASENLVIEIEIDEMSQFDDTGAIKANAYVMQAGAYDIYVGNSVKDAGKHKVATYTENSDRIIKECAAFDTHLLKRLTSDGTYEYLDIDDYTIKSTGMTVIEAEDIESATNEREEIAGTVYVGVSQGRLLRLTSNRTFRYRVYVEKAGTYNISFNMANGSGTDYTNMFEIYVDDTPNDGVDNGKVQNISANLASSGSWTAWKVIYGNTITFEKSGEHLLTFKTNTCADFDFFTVYSNNVAPAGETQINGDTYSSINGGHQEASMLGNLASNLRVSGRYVEYKVNVTKAGTYYLSLDAVTPFKASQNVCDIYVNGTKAGTLKALRSAANPEETNGTDTNTSASIDCWYTSVETSSVAVNLTAGENTIKILVTESDTLCNVKRVIIRTAQQAFTWKDNTSDYVFKSYTEATNGTGGTGYQGYRYVDILKGECTIEQFLRQMSVHELVALSMLQEPRADNNSGTGGVGGIPGWNLTSSDYYELPYASTTDGPAGQRFCNPDTFPDGSIYRYATWFPCVTLLTATWNVDMAYLYGQQYATEAQVTNTSILLCPGVNIHRNPLCGRNFEYMSEDPFITGMTASYYINGMQSVGVNASIKHYAVNSQEVNRFNTNANVSARALREIYLKAFEMAIENSNPGSLMSSYNYVNGVSVSASTDLLKTFLRDELGYEGMIESDWGENTLNVLMIKGGNNAHSYVDDYYNTILAWQQGTLTYDELVENVTYIIKMIIRSNATSLGNYVYTDTDKSMRSKELLTRTDSAGVVWEFNHTKNINVISQASSVVSNVAGIAGIGKTETADQTTYVSNIANGSVAFYAISVATPGDYYLSYTLNIGGDAYKFGNFYVVIDGVKVDTFTNPDKFTSASSGDWVSEDVFVGDNGSAKVTLTRGVHKVVVIFKDEHINFHNILFSYGSPRTQGIIKNNGKVQMRNYASISGGMRIEGDHLASLMEGTEVIYNLDFAETAKYGLNYYINCPGHDGIYGAFDVYLDGTKVDTFTNPNKITTSQDSALYWSDFKTYYGDNGEVMLNITKGKHTLKVVGHEQNINLKYVNFRYVSAEEITNNASLTDNITGSKIAGASIWMSNTDVGGIRYAMKISASELANGKVIAVRVKSTVDVSKVTLDNYASFGGIKVETKVEKINGEDAYVAEFKPEDDFTTSYTVKFFIQSTVDDLTVYKTAIVSDARSCKQVAQNLISGGKYTSEQLGYYLV